MQPGDLIEWVYKHNGQPIDKKESIYSVLMNRWAPLRPGGIHILISFDSEQITWINEERIYRTYPEDIIVRAQTYEMKRS